MTPSFGNVWCAGASADARDFATYHLWVSAVEFKPLAHAQRDEQHDDGRDIRVQ